MKIGFGIVGCGMIAVRTSLTASQLPDTLRGLRTRIEAAVPHGRTNDGGPGDRGAYHLRHAQRAHHAREHGDCGGPVSHVPGDDAGGPARGRTPCGVVPRPGRG